MTHAITLIDQIERLMGENRRAGRELGAKGKGNAAVEIDYAKNYGDGNLKYARKTYNRTVRHAKKDDIKNRLNDESLDDVLQSLLDENVSELLFERIDLVRPIKILLAKASDTKALGEQLVKMANEADATKSINIQVLQTLSRTVDSNAKELKGAIARLLSAAAI